MKPSRRAVPAIFAVLFALALPTTALGAVTYTVDSLGDQPDKEIGAGDCETAVGTCTLRAAIQEDNFTVGEKDKIIFDPGVFKGKAGDTIVLGSALPAIVDPIVIDGDGLNDNLCTREPSSINELRGPCVEISGPDASTPALTVDNTDGVTIEGLSITGSRTAIEVANGSSKFVAHGDWLGVKLDGTSGGNTTGISIGPDSNEAMIGGFIAADRNVVGNNAAEGLDIQGADDAVVAGNYFGVEPDGATQAANGKDIEITDTVGFEANRDQVGATVAAAAGPCDGGCNVISGATSAGIDLNGNGIGQLEAPASGPTLIHGNFIGLNAAGTGTVANAGWGVLAGGADEVMVGGSLLSDANYLSGGSEGIVSEEGESFIARGNRLGFSPSGFELTAPDRGIFALDQSVSQPANIEQNVVRANGVGIEQIGSTGHVTANAILGGTVGIWVRNEPGGGLLAGNFIEAPSEYGILVESPDNDVRENAVVESGGAGIRVKPPTGGMPMSGVSVGGGSEEQENLIEGSAGAAIEIFEAAGEPRNTTEITRNQGSLNGGPFIDLVAGANEGIAPPVVSGALQSSATGTALPGSVVRVFSKASAEPGELQGYLGEATADGSGNWKATFPAVPAGTLVTATQTNGSHATSELAMPVAAASESSGGGGGGGNGGGSSSSGGGSNSGGPTPDEAPPGTRITKAPPKKTKKTTVRFKFRATEAGSTFQCRLDRKPFRACRSPRTYRKLKPGKHVFKVRAVDPAGNVDPTPAKRKFTVLR